MSNARWWTLIATLLVAAGAIIWLGRDEPPPPPAQPAVPAADETGSPPAKPAGTETGLPLPVDEFSQAVTRQADGVGLGEVSNLELIEYTPGSITIRLIYGEHQEVAEAKARQDVTLVAEAAVKALTAAGWNPRLKRTMIFVHALRRAGKGATGQDLFTKLANARYDHNDDGVKLRSP